MDSSAWDARYAAVPDLVWTSQPNRFAVEFSSVAIERGRQLAGERGGNVEWRLADRREVNTPRRVI